MNIMFQESIAKKEKRLKRQKIFWIVVFWLLSIFFSYWAIDLFKVSQLDFIDLIDFIFASIGSLICLGCVGFCISCIIKI